MKRLFIIFMSLMLVMSLVGCNSEKDSVKSIEEEINNISNINNLEEKLVSIMNIEKKIRKLSNEEKDNIMNMELFHNEAKKTSLVLKENVSWSQFLNMDVDYLILSDFVNIGTINKIRFIKNYSSLQIFIEKKEIIYDIINLIDVPYIDRIILSNNNIDIHDILILDSIDFYFFQVYIDDNYYMNVDVYSNGYVKMSVTNNNINNSYMSIVKIDFNRLKNICAYENLGKE